jgi:hypothetical protein
MKLKMAKIGRNGKNLSKEGRYLIKDSAGELRIVFLSKWSGEWWMFDYPHMSASFPIDKEEANYLFFGPIETI